MKKYLLIVAISVMLSTNCDMTSSDDSVKQTDPSITEEPADGGTTAGTNTHQFDESILINTSGKTVIRLMTEESSFLLISKSGTLVMLDPYIMPFGFNKADIITVTHDHYDHYDTNFINKVTCYKSIFKVESFTVKDVTVTSLASSHFNDTIDIANPSNVIYIFEIDGLRIAHMGDIGQTVFTAEQLAALGKIDIAFMQFVNMFSEYTADNAKGIALIEQLKPQIIIPTHSNSAATQKIAAAVGQYASINDVLIIDKNDLADGIRKVIDLNKTVWY